MKLSFSRKALELLAPLAALALSLGLTAPARASSADCQAMPTKFGPVSGKLDATSGLCVYKGIPFAAPPVGPLRLKLPQPHPGWKEPLSTIRFDKGCWRFPIAFPPRPVPVGEEDCLHLNVWHKAGAEPGKKPVMVWIHGGGFVTGEGGSDFYDGTRLVNLGDVVVVTVNYRLGPFGFITHPELMKEKDFAPNLAFYDQLEALKWVKQNITQFGGDPGNVTIFGESAGGMSVAALQVSPLAKGLFHKAINESGPMAMFQGTLPVALEEGKKLATHLGCTTPGKVGECLRKLSARDLFMKAPASFRLGPAPKAGEVSFRYGPVIDGKFIPAHTHKLFEEGKFNATPVLIGNTKDEMALFLMGKSLDSKEQALSMVEENKNTLKNLLNLDVDMKAFISLYNFEDYPTVRDAAVQASSDLAFRCPARQNALQLAAKNPDVFVYEFAQGPADKGAFAALGAFHGSELAFVFGVFNFLGFKFESDVNRALSDKTIALWTSFAHTGKPSGEGLPAWPAFDAKTRQIMVLATPVSVQAAPDKPGCGFVRDFLAPLAK